MCVCVCQMWMVMYVCVCVLAPFRSEQRVRLVMLCPQNEFRSHSHFVSGVFLARLLCLLLFGKPLSTTMLPSDPKPFFGVYILLHFFFMCVLLVLTRFLLRPIKEAMDSRVCWICFPLWYKIAFGYSISCVCSIFCVCCIWFMEHFYRRIGPTLEV